ncbi:MAG: rRNA pseudouridine synthase [Candidatus Coatesbacteria bacterium]|nr:MAG: rRNA pseudouridine synthase [Candidatus Coatesbacteria bacterium]
MAPRVRLNRYLARCGIGSRRACDTIIADGRVKVNGEIVAKLGACINEGDEVAVDGKPVEPAKEYRYYAFNKPRGVLTTAKDPYKRKIVKHLLPPWLRDLKPVGRLDRDTEGLLLLTDDGSFAQRVAHPSGGVVKRYEITVKGVVAEKDLKKLETGVALPDGHIGRGMVTAVRESDDVTVVVLEVGYGRKRMIRRMFGALGYKIAVLRRSAVGPVELGNLEPGKFRELTAREVAALLET